MSKNNNYIKFIVPCTAVTILLPVEAVLVLVRVVIAVIGVAGYIDCLRWTIRTVALKR